MIGSHVSQLRRYISDSNQVLWCIILWFSSVASQTTGASSWTICTYVCFECVVLVWKCVPMCVLCVNRIGAAQRSSKRGVRHDPRDPVSARAKSESSSVACIIHIFYFFSTYCIISVLFHSFSYLFVCWALYLHVIVVHAVLQVIELCTRLFCIITLLWLYFFSALARLRLYPFVLKFFSQKFLILQSHSIRFFRRGPIP